MNNSYDISDKSQNLTGRVLSLPILHPNGTTTKKTLLGRPVGPKDTPSPPLPREGSDDSNETLLRVHRGLRHPPPSSSALFRERSGNQQAPLTAKRIKAQDSPRRLR